MQEKNLAWILVLRCFACLQADSKFKNNIKTKESIAHGDHLRILLNGGIRFCKGGDLAQAVKLVQILAALWNFILAQNNSNDEDDDIDECPQESPIPDGDVETDPQPKPTLQPSNIQILNRYFR